MSNQLVLAIVLLAVLGAGGYFFLFSPGGGGSDAAGRALIARVAEQREKNFPDKDDCRDILKALRAHPGKGTDRGVIRAIAWTEFLLGRSRRALDALEQNLEQAATEDDEIGALVIAARFHETGDGDLGHRAAVLAQRHFEATNAKESLFLAWQLQMRIGESKRAENLATKLQSAFGDSAEARLTKVLVKYPRPEDKAAIPELKALETRFSEMPFELDVALGLLEADKPETAPDAEERADRVLKAFPTCVPARFVKGWSHMQQGQFAAGKTVFEGLRRRHPKHPMAGGWEQMIEWAEQMLARKGK